MAKKKSDAPPAGAKTRKTPLPVEFFRAEASALKAYAAAMSKIADTMDDRKLAALGVLGQSMYHARGKRWVERFILNAQRELT